MAINFTVRFMHRKFDLQCVITKGGSRIPRRRGVDHWGRAEYDFAKFPEKPHENKEILVGVGAGEERIFAASMFCVFELCFLF